MNEPNRFFRIINHINSLFILIFFVVIATLGILNFEPPWKKSRGIDIKNIAEQGKSEKISFSLVHIEQLRGLSIQMLRLSIKEKNEKFSSGGYGYEDIICNVLFLSNDFKEHRWLFPNNSFIIKAFKQLPEEEDCLKQNPVCAIFYEVVKQDSNGDGKVFYDDRKVAALSKPDGTGYVEIISDADRIIENKTVNQDTELAVLFEKGGKIIYQTFSLDNFSKTSEKVLTELPVKP